MGDLADALRAEGHTEIADQLERRELAGRLRESGRPDLADELITGETPPVEEPEPAPEPEAEHERLARQLNAAQSRWLTLGGPGGSDGEAA